ncbi:MAG TPA: DUF4395 family protein [Chloroflexaceae bacterium]|nr:DUF4395 family protein [Chloroflexaceae bacterium]
MVDPRRAVAAANLLGAAAPPLAQLYLRALRPTALVRPEIVPDFHAPHRFAQALSGGVTALAAALVWAGLAAPGWAFSWLIVVLAGLNVFAGFCAGCFTYYQLSRLGVPGFRRARAEP